MPAPLVEILWKSSEPSIIMITDLRYRLQNELSAGTCRPAYRGAFLMAANLLGYCLGVGLTFFSTMTA